MEDISFEKVQSTIDVISEKGNRVLEDPLTFLYKKDLIREGLLTNASFLLFTNKESVLTTIELGRFQNEILIKDSLRTQSDILTQVEQVLFFIKKHINKEVIITGNARSTEKWQYPLEALREIVMNMIVHRDYRASSDAIVKIFDHKIEFYNLGQLPAYITVENLLSNNYKSAPRNKIIADFFKSLGFIEKYGSGINRIINCFKEENLPKPTFENHSGGFLVTVFGKKQNNVTDNVTDRIDKIIQFIKDNNKITATTLAKKLNVSKRTILRDIALLKEQHKLQRINGEKTGYWKIKLNKTI